MSPQIPYVILDVFTSIPFQGNPLAIVLPTPDVSLTQSQKFALTREFNLSETVFLSSPIRPCDQNSTISNNNNDTNDINENDPPADHPISIYITAPAELPFAGHPTIGTANHLVHHTQSRADALLTKAGRIPIAPATTATGQRRSGIALAVPHDVHVHPGKPVLGGASPLAVAGVVLDSALVSVVRGVTFAIVRVGGLEALGRVEPGSGMVGRPGAGDVDGEWEEGKGLLGTYYFVEEGIDGDGEDGGEDGMVRVRMRTRMVDGWFGVEHPASGSAACALSAWRSLVMGRRRVGYEIVQGVEMGRRCDIGIEVKLREGLAEVERIALSGDAVRVGEGMICVPDV